RRYCPCRILAMRLRVYVPRPCAPHLSGLRIVSQNDPVFSLWRNREGSGVRVQHATNGTRPETLGETCRRPMALDAPGVGASVFKRDAGDGAASPAASGREPLRLLLAAQFHGRGAA